MHLRNLQNLTHGKQGILSNKKNEPQKPSEPYAWKNSALIPGDVLPTSPMNMAFIGQMKADKQLKTNTLT